MPAGGEKSQPFNAPAKKKKGLMSSFHPHNGGRGASVPGTRKRGRLKVLEKKKGGESLLAKHPPGEKYHCPSPTLPEKKVD